MLLFRIHGLIDRNGYKVYSDKQNCKDCPELERCCKKQDYRIIRRHIMQEMNDLYRDIRLSERGKQLYSLRKEKIERSFADSKQNHGYRYAMYRGLEKNQNYTWLICAAQNMKNIVTKLTKKPKKKKGDPSFSTNIYSFYANLYKLVKFIQNILSRDKPHTKKYVVCLHSDNW